MRIIWSILGTIAILFVIALAGTIGGQVGRSVSGEIAEADKSAEFDTVLITTASKINKSLPMMIDKDTRLDSTTGINKTFQYHYTMVSMVAEKVDQAKLENQFAPMVKNRACTSADMAIFFENEVAVDYVYHDKDGKNITTISVTPAECGY